MTHYTSINDMPIFNFDMICKSGDTSYLFKDGKKQDNVDDVELWSNIYNEFLDFFGLSKEFKKYLKLKAKATRLYMDAMCSGKKHLITFAKLYDSQADKSISDIEGGDLAITSAGLSKFFGFRINPMEVTVKEYYAYINQAKNENNGE